MKPHHLLVALLVLANVFGGSALVAVVFTLQESWPNTLPVITLGVGLGQLALVAAWFAWGRWHVVFRAGVLLAAILAWLFPLAQCTGDDHHATRWGGILLLYGLCVALPLALVRLSGLTMLLDGRPPAAAGKVRPWQFTVGGVLSLTALAAILLGTARHLDFPWQKAVPASLFCAASAAGAAVCVFVAFRASHS